MIRTKWEIPNGNGESIQVSVEEGKACLDMLDDGEMVQGIEMSLGVFQTMITAAWGWLYTMEQEVAYDRAEEQGFRDGEAS